MTGKACATVLSIFCSTLILGGCVTITPVSQSVRAYNVRAIASANISGSVGSVPISPSQAQRLATIEERIAKASGVRIHHFVVTMEPDLNAKAAVKDGRNWLAITLPLLRKLSDDDDAIAALIGHEQAHLALDHGASRDNVLTTVNGAAQILSIAAGMFVPGAGVLVSSGGLAIARMYSRTQEDEADLAGMQFAVKAGYSPTGAIRMLEALPVRGDGATGMFDSHPAKAGRIAAMKAAIER